jgi:hypothetical protein
MSSTDFYARRLTLSADEGTIIEDSTQTIVTKLGDLLPGMLGL